MQEQELCLCAPPSETLVSIYLEAPSGWTCARVCASLFVPDGGEQLPWMRRPLDLAPADEGLFPVLSPTGLTFPLGENPSAPLFFLPILSPSVVCLPSILPPSHPSSLPLFLALILISGFLSDLHEENLMMPTWHLSSSSWSSFIEIQELKIWKHHSCPFSLLLTCSFLSSRDFSRTGGTVAFMQKQCRDQMGAP